MWPEMPGSVVQGLPSEQAPLDTHCSRLRVPTIQRALAGVMGEDIPSRELGFPGTQHHCGKGFKQDLGGSR